MRKFYGLKWSWQNLFDGAPWWKHSRAWVFLERHVVGLEWVARSRDCGMSVGFDYEGEIRADIAVPFVIALYFSVTGCRWVTKLPGVKYSGWGTGDREIGFSFHSGALWVTLWANPSEYPRRGFTLDFADLLLGRSKYSESDVTTGTTEIVMPEGAYEATYRLYTSIWKRPRWPWPKRMKRGYIEVKGGIPVPGKGENSWDMDDDAITDMTTPANTLDDLIAAIKKSVERDRKRHGGDGWRADGGKHAVDL